MSNASYANLVPEMRDGVLLLAIEVADRPVNMLTDAFLDDLERCIGQLRSDSGVRGAVFYSQRPAFLAGADLKRLASVPDSGMSAAQFMRESRRYGDLLRQLETCGKPVAAAITGAALGGGLELALACHYRVLADDARVVIGLPEVKLGLMPGGGGTQRLPRLIGIRRALELLTEGTDVKAARALELGIVDALAPLAETLKRAVAYVLESGEVRQPWDREKFQLPGGAGAMHPAVVESFCVATALTARASCYNYAAPISILSAMYEGTSVPFGRGLEIEHRYFARLAVSVQARNMIRTLFIAKGDADRLVRRPPGVPRREFKRIGVVGAGMMGAGIAYAAARRGVEVVLLDRTAEQAQAGREYARGVLDKRLKRGEIEPSVAAATLDRIEATANFSQLAGCDLLIEAVFEDRGVKAEVTRQAERFLQADAVFASNTSTLPIGELAKASARPAQFIGLHFFSPVERMPLVEVIVAKGTSVATLAHALDFVAQLGKTPIVVNDRRYFYTSRVFGAFTTEGEAMLGEGISPALIENAARLAGMPVGPLAVRDEVSLTLTWSVLEHARRDLGSRWRRPAGYETLRRMLEEFGRRGRREGGGYYEYPPEGPKRLWPGLAQAFPCAAQQPAIVELQDRLLYIQALETARSLEEGVVTSAAEADLGSIFGWGFAPFTGGTLSFIDMVGIGPFVRRCEWLARRHGSRYRPSAWLRERARRGQPFHPVAG